MSEANAKKILIAEDEETLRNVLGDALVANGFQVILAKDGQDTVVQARDAHPDLILLDVLMPRMDGRAALKVLRADPATRNTPIIFLTNLSELDTISDTLDAGVSGYIVKSDWSIDDIVKKVKNQLAKNSGN